MPDGKLGVHVVTFDELQKLIAQSASDIARDPRRDQLFVLAQLDIAI